MRKLLLILTLFAFLLSSCYDNAESKAAGVTCNGIAVPTNKPTPNGYWSCTDTGWKWFEDIGRSKQDTIIIDTLKH